MGNGIFTAQPFTKTAAKNAEPGATDVGGQIDMIASALNVFVRISRVSIPAGTGNAGNDDAGIRGLLSETVTQRCIRFDLHTMLMV
jgi:hypothetical protein